MTLESTEGLHPTVKGEKERERKIETAFKSSRCKSLRVNLIHRDDSFCSLPVLVFHRFIARHYQSSYVALRYKNSRKRMCVRSRKLILPVLFKKLFVIGANREVSLGTAFFSFFPSVSSLNLWRTHEGEITKVTRERWWWKVRHTCCAIPLFR